MLPAAAAGAAVAAPWFGRHYSTAFENKSKMHKMSINRRDKITFVQNVNLLKDWIVSSTPLTMVSTKWFFVQNNVERVVSLFGSDGGICIVSFLNRHIVFDEEIIWQISKTQICSLLNPFVFSEPARSDRSASLMPLSIAIKLRFRWCFSDWVLIVRGVQFIGSIIHWPTNGLF